MQHLEAISTKPPPRIDILNWAQQCCSKNHIHRETGRTDAEANDIYLKDVHLKHFSFMLSIFSFHCFIFMDSKHQTSFDPEEGQSFLTNA